MNPIAQAMAKALFVGVEELAPFPPQEVEVAFLRAQYHAQLADYPHARNWCHVQSFAPYADRLRDAGYAVQPDMPDGEGRYQRVLYLATRFAEENLASFAHAWHVLAAGGWLLVAQHNDLGAKRLDGALKKLGSEVLSLSKFHCRVLAVQKPQQVTEATTGVLRDWQKAGEPRKLPDVPLVAAPGTFSWRKVDAGSRFLAESLPATLSGRGADIAAGWGYLSWELLKKCDSIHHITLIEAEKRALELAERNLQDELIRCSFHWADATRMLDTGGQPFDWAISNPPAHDMLHTAPEASAALFARTAEALKTGGRFYMVANRHLPYERTLHQLFGAVDVRDENADFKILEATKCA